ncbi:MAG: hypothetical protein HN350_07595, partial [Phycisphaerales bacterium]|nr:hypothetical protein [Phycisphaerales bacterium]
MFLMRTRNIITIVLAFAMIFSGPLSAWAAVPAVTLDWNATSDTTANSTWEADAGGKNWSLKNMDYSNRIDLISTGFNTSTLTHSYNFNGTNEYGTTGTLATGNTNASFEFLFKPSDYTDTGNEMIVETGGSGDGTAIYIKGSTLRLWAKNQGVNAQAEFDLSTISTTPDDFFHVVGVINLTDDKVDLYVNGALQTTAIATGDDADLKDWAGSDGAGLGRNNGTTPTSNAHYGGEIAFMRLYDNALLDSTDAMTLYDNIAINEMIWTAGATPDTTWANTGNWDIGSAIPNDNTRAILDTANTITLDSDASAYKLVVSNGGAVEVSAAHTMTLSKEISLDATSTLTVNGALTTGGITAASGSVVTFGNNAQLTVGATGGTLGAVSTNGYTVVNTAGTVTMDSFNDNTTAGVFTKIGDGTLTLAANNTGDGTVVADHTVFNVSNGTLAGSGTDPLGGATVLVLNGGTFETIGAETLAAPTYQYYRFNPTKTRSNNPMQISELEFLFEGSELTYPNITANASDFNGTGVGSQSPDKLFDNTVNTKYYIGGSFAQNQWVMFNFGTPTAIDEYTFATANDMTARDPVRWLLEGSNDNATWTIIDDQSAADYATPTARKTRLPSNIAVNELVYGAIDLPNLNITVTSGSNLVARTDSTATFGSLALNNGTVNVTGTEDGAIFSGNTTVASGATAGVTSSNALTLGTLTVGENAVVTVGGPAASATSLTITDDIDADNNTRATFNTTGVFNAGTYDDGANTVAITQTGSGTMQLLGLESGAADGTTFTVQDGGTLEFSGDNALGGSAAPLNMNGGTIRINGPQVAPVAPAGAVAHWGFDETSGLTAIDSAGGHNGTLAGFDGDDSQWVDGHVGGALRINGDNDGELVNAVGYKGIGGTQARTTAAWIKTTDTDGTIVSWGKNTGGQKWVFRTQTGNGPNGAIRTEVNGGYLVGETIVADGDWHHVAMVLPNGANNVSQMLVYIDGLLEPHSNTLGKGINTASGNDVQIGVGFGGQKFTGLIDELYMYDSALTQEQIAELATGMIPTPISMTDTDLNVTNDSTLDAVTPLSAAFGNLTFAAPSVLTTSGAGEWIGFLSATLATGENGFNIVSDTLIGEINVADGIAATIVKTGAADLILPSADPLIAAGGSVAFDVRQGGLIVQAGSNPLGDGSAVGINGGELMLISSAPATNVTFDNQITSTGGTLTAGADDDDNIGPLTVTVGNAAGNNVTLTSGTLVMQTTDNYTLNIAGTVSGAGNMTVGANSTVTAAQTIDAGIVTIDAGANLSVSGAVTVNELVSNGGGLALNGNNLTTKKLSTASGTFDMGATGTFIATGDITGSNQVELNSVGGTLTIGTTPSNLQLHLDAADASTLYQDADGTIAAADGTSVSLWRDKSGNGNDVVRTNDVNRPVYDVTTNQLNGEATLHFTADNLGRANDIGITGNADRTVVTVWHNGSGTANYNHVLHMGDAVDGQAYGHASKSNGVIANHYWHDGFETSAATAYSQANIAISTWDGDGGTDVNGLDSWYVNGDFAGAYERAALDTGAGALLIGSRLGPQSEGMNANIAEVLVFDKVLTANEIASVGGYLKDKWGVAAPAWTGSMGGVMNMASTNLLMTTETAIHLTSDVNLGSLTVGNASPSTLTFTGAVGLNLNLTGTSFANNLDGTAPNLSIVNAPNVNLGALNLNGSTAPVIQKTGAGQLIITDEVTGYIGAVTYNINEGGLTLGDPGLVGGEVNMAGDTVLKLSSSLGDKTYNETFNFTGNTAVIAGRADASSAAAATITLPALNLPTQAVTLGAENTYTLAITAPLAADTLAITGAGNVTLNAGGSATSLSVTSGTLNVNTAPIATPSISVTGSGSLNMGVAQETANLLVDTSGVVSVSNPLTVTSKITLGGIEITDSEAMDIVGGNLGDADATITVAGGAFAINGAFGGPVPSGAELYYSFDNQVNPLSDDSVGAGHNGLPKNFYPAWTAGGVLNGAVTFDGAVSGVQPMDTAFLTDAINAVTVAMWIDQDVTTGTQILLDEGGATNGFAIVLDEGILKTKIKSGDNILELSSGTALSDETHHIGVVFGNVSSKFELYIDGALVDDGIYALTAVAAHGDLPGIGYLENESPLTGGRFSGLMDELYYYDTGLSAEQIGELYAAPTIHGAVDMPKLAINLGTDGPATTINLNASTATLGDLTMGANTDLTIAGTDTASFNNVTVNAGATSINTSGAAIATTIRGTLATAGGTDLTNNFTVNGDLTVANMSAVDATITAKNFTATGDVSFGGTSGLALTSSTLTVANGSVTTFADASTTSNVTAIEVAGRMNVASSGVSTETLNVASGAVLNASAPVTVSSQTTIGDTVVAEIAGGTFGVSGSDVLSAHTLTLNGGTMTLTGQAEATVYGTTGNAIGVNFRRTSGQTEMLPTDIAGVDVAHANWNNSDGGVNGTTATIAGPIAATLVDQDGAATTATIEWWSNTNYSNNNGGNGDEKMMTGYLDDTGNAGTAGMKFENIPYAMYGVYAYMGSDVNGRTGHVQVVEDHLNPTPTALDTFHYKTYVAGLVFPDDYVRMTATSGDGISSNYALWEGL